jgi:hypothetical protein
MATQSTFSLLLTYDIPPADNILSFDAPTLETHTIDSLTLERYHDICTWHLRQYPDLSTSVQEPVKLGAILSFSSELAEWVEIASLPESGIDCSSWEAYRDVAGETTIEGWTR